MTEKPVIDDKRSSRKISRDEWTAIAARYGNGESLAAIGRDYNCTAPAIRYILQQHARADGVAPEAHDVIPRRPRHRGRTLDPKGASPIAAAGEAPPATSFAQPERRSSPNIIPSGFDPDLRDRMAVELSVFLVAFETVMAKPTAEDLDRLREATDRLMRAAARVRIELDRVRIELDRVRRPANVVGSLPPRAQGTQANVDHHVNSAASQL